MLSDIAVLGVIAVMLYFGYANPLAWIVSFLALWAWKKQGGFIAWHRESRQEFMQNAKKLGL